jgi:autotransporter-associated beta strand protein
LTSRQSQGPLTVGGGAISVSVTGDNPKWTGLDNGNWQVGSTGANKNWKLVTAGTATDYIELDNVLFDDTATGTTSVDISTASVSPSATTFNNSTKNYTLGSVGGFGIQTGFLTKSGTGSLTINTSNSFTGGTTFNGGLLNLGNAAALGNGPLTIATGNAKTLDNTTGGALTLSTITAQAWNDDFSFAGVADGTHDIDMGSGDVTVGGSGTDRTVTASAGTLTVGELRAPTQGLVKQGAGTLILSSTGNGGNGAGLDGSVISGALNAAAGTVQFNRTGTNSGDFTAGGLTGAGRVVTGADNERWLIVNNSGNFSFTGTLESGGSGALGFYKTGAGSQTLTGNNTITGTLTANAGTLTLSGNNNLGAITVNAGTLRLEGANTTTSATTLNTGGTIVVANPGALGNTQRVNVIANGGSATLTFATDTDTTVATGIGLGSVSTLNLISDRATPGAAVDRTLTVPTPAQNGGGIGGGVMNFTAGPNVTSGLGRITFTQFGLGAGSTQTTTLNPTGVNLTLPDVTKYNNTPVQTLDLGGTTAGNVITGVISNGTATSVNLSKSNTSTWAISGNNTYTGGTVVNGGTLLVNNTAGSGTGTAAVTVNSGGTLGGTGTIVSTSTVTVNAGGSVAPGVSAGTLTLSATGGVNLSPMSAGGLAFELGAPASSDKLVVSSGTLTLGQLDFSDFAFTTLPGITAGTYTLIDAASTMAVSLGTVSGSIPGYNATLSVDNTTAFDVFLTLTPAGVAGDYNNDAKVNAADYVMWRKNPNGFGGDPGGYNTWRANFGTGGPGSGAAAGSLSAAVPEPSTLFMLVAGLLAMSSRRRSKTP